MPDYVGEVDALGTLRLLDAIRLLIIHASSIRHLQVNCMDWQEVPQSETTPFYPRSPYGVAKLYAYWITRNYREAYGIHASNGILFNHESPRRGETFVTRKITRGLSKISAGLQDVLEHCNLDAQRVTGGHAKDYVRGMWMIAQHETPDDFVLATGTMRSVRQFVEEAAQYFGFNIEWRGEGESEVGFCKAMNRDIIRVNPKYYRPTEVEQLLGDPSKARNVLGWEPEITFKELVEDMCIYGQ